MDDPLKENFMLKISTWEVEQAHLKTSTFWILIIHKSFMKLDHQVVIKCKHLVAFNGLEEAVNSLQQLKAIKKQQTHYHLIQLIITSGNTSVPSKASY